LVEISVVLNQDIVQLAGRNVDSDFPQLFQQQGLCNMAMVVLIQDEANKLYSEVFAAQLRRRVAIT